MKTKNYNEFKRLYWKTDKEQINNILQRIPDKYLISLIKQTRAIDYPNEKSLVYANYDGCRFKVSAKSLKKESVRRGLGEWKKCTYSEDAGYYYVRKGY